MLINMGQSSQAAHPYSSLIPYGKGGGFMEAKLQEANRCPIWVELCLLPASWLLQQDDRLLTKCCLVGQISHLSPSVKGRPVGSLGHFTMRVKATG